MSFEQFGNMFSVLMNVAGLMMCLYWFVRKPNRAWVYAMIFLLAHFMSNYYWSIYVLVMGEDPTTSSLLAYFGWNVAFLVLPILQLRVMSPDERHFFSPFALLPIPLNIYQFFLYLPYGGLFSNIWQGFFATAIACISLNSILCYVKTRNQRMRPPYVALVSFVYVLTEYTMWTSSCFDWPSQWTDPYNYAAILNCLTYILFPLAIRSMLTVPGEEIDYKDTNRLQMLFRPIYLIAVSVGCIGGYFLAVWMRHTLNAGISGTGDTDPYRVIAVVLFVISVVIVSFSVTTVFIVSSLQKSAESEEYRRAMNVAERANNAKSEFLASMSHEIRTPISSVLGMNEMIMRESLRARDVLPDDREDIRSVFADICNYAGNIESAGNSLLALIGDILDFSKIEAGKLELVTGEYRLSSVLNDVSNMISFKAGGKGLDFRVEVEESIPERLSGDEYRVRQILTNLLNNAVKYTNRGSVLLQVSTGGIRETESGKTADLIIRVEDTGIGIKESDMDILFTRFGRVDPDRNNSVEGTGLGLTITKSLAEMMDGQVEVKSVYGKGSVFTVTIPQTVLSDEPIGDFRQKFEQSIDSKHAREESFRARGAKILVVDDTLMNLIVVKGLLKGTELGIDTCLSGEEAVAMAERHAYDVILMDQRMPEMDGVTAMRLIREGSRSKNPTTPVICLTADALTGARERYLADGFDDYLSKPIDAALLEKKLLAHLPAEKIIRPGQDVDHSGQA